MPLTDAAFHRTKSSPKKPARKPVTDAELQQLRREAEAAELRRTIEGRNVDRVEITHRHRD